MQNGPRGSHNWLEYLRLTVMGIICDPETDPDNDLHDPNNSLHNDLFHFVATDGFYLISRDQWFHKSSIG